jgi:hypothetical protein
MGDKLTLEKAKIALCYQFAEIGILAEEVPDALGREGE